MTLESQLQLNSSNLHYRLVNYDCSGFIRLATVVKLIKHFTSVIYVSRVVPTRKLLILQQ